MKTDIKINVLFVLIKSERNPIIFQKLSNSNYPVLLLNSEYPKTSQNIPFLKPNLTLNRNMDKIGKDRGIIDLRYLK